MNLNIPRPSRDYLKYNIISGLLDPGRVQEDAALAGNGRRRQVLAELAADDAVVAVRLADLAPDRTELAAVDLPLGLVNVGHPVTERHGGSASARSHMGAEQTAARQPRQEFRGHTPTKQRPRYCPQAEDPEVALAPTSARGGVRSVRIRTTRTWVVHPRGFAASKLAAWSVCGCCLFLPEWHHSPRRGPAQLPP